MMGCRGPAGEGAALWREQIAWMQARPHDWSQDLQVCEQLICLLCLPAMFYGPLPPGLFLQPLRACKTTEALRGACGWIRPGDRLRSPAKRAELSWLCPSVPSAPDSLGGAEDSSSQGLREVSGRPPARLTTHRLGSLPVAQGSPGQGPGSLPSLRPVQTRARERQCAADRVTVVSFLSRRPGHLPGVVADGRVTVDLLPLPALLPSWESRACGQPREVGEAAPRVGTARLTETFRAVVGGMWLWTDCESP